VCTAASACSLIVIVITHRRFSIINNGGGLKLTPRISQGILFGGGEVKQTTGGSTPQPPGNSNTDCDASNGTVGSQLVQWRTDGIEVPISFASSKLSGAQLSWAAVEKEAYAVIWALKKLRTCIFGSHITIFSDSNPLSFLTSIYPVWFRHRHFIAISIFKSSLNIALAIYIVYYACYTAIHETSFIMLG
jgi:hypothetical protein